MNSKSFGNIGVSLQPIGKFYFLDYFYILLRSVESHSSYDMIFENFKRLKNKYHLGESKYKKLTSDGEKLTDRQLTKYQYTLGQVIAEAIVYKLIFLGSKNEIILTENGNSALGKFNESKFEFNKYVIELMESETRAFFYLLDLSYNKNELKNGLMVFPIYSPSKLGFAQSYFKTSGDILEYSSKLLEKISLDLKTYTNKKDLKLIEAERDLIKKLVEDNIIGIEKSDTFDNRLFNSVINRFRKFWLTFFLREVYEFKYTYSIFNLLIERGKQIGVLNTTEFFPNINGRVVYPTSIISKGVTNSDFVPICEYPNKMSLFIYKPHWNDDNQEIFVDSLVTNYFQYKSIRKTHFISLADLRERVCFKMRIPSFVFDEFLEKAYNLNLKGQLRKIQIALEADRLPQETNAMYIKREPVLVNGKYKNIIAINYRQK